MKTLLVYIAHPYTHPDPVRNTHHAIAWANMLVQRGFVPYIPHLNLLWHLVTPKEPNFWYEYDLHFLKRCDAVLRVGGASQGAVQETLVAKGQKIPVFRSIESLVSWREML
jgi:nucleoside 2-deoxyribosyltransferase